MRASRYAFFTIVFFFGIIGSCSFAQNNPPVAEPAPPAQPNRTSPAPAQRVAPVPPPPRPQIPPARAQQTPPVVASQADSQPPAPVQPSQQAPVAAPPERRLLPPPSAPSAGMVSLNFNRADLVEIIHIIAQHLRLTYTIDPEVKGTVTINSAAPLRAEDLLPIFHQILRMNGAVAVKTGNLYRIMPIKEGKGLARPVGENKEDSYALQIVPVRFFSVAEMKKVLTPFLQPGGEIIENPRGNFLIIMDLPSNIRRLIEIADMVDVQVFAGTRMEIYQPKVASAEELGQEMTKVMQSFAASAPQAENFAAEFVPLPRINQLLVISHSEAAWTYAKRWLDRIDVVAEGPGRRIFIYPVENGKATELADVLSQAFGQPSTGSRGSSRTLEDLHRSITGSSGFGTNRPTTSGFGTPGMTQQYQPPGGSFAAVAAPGQTPAPGGTPVPAVPRPLAPGSPPAKAEEQLRIVPDPATNSLVVYGTAQEFQNIKNILKELDQVPRQVLLDVLVAEVTLKDNQSFGIEWEIFRGHNPTIFGQTFGSTGAVRSGILPQIPTDSSGAPLTTLTPFGNGISGVIGQGSVRAFINALATDSRVKILSSPSVLATDNRPARIQVGSEEPIPTGSLATPISTGTGGVVSTPTTGFATSTTVQYRNTGRIVTIIPQVNSQGLVNLQILAEVSQRGANVIVGQDSFPAFDTRQAETTAVVQDGDTLAIGGIIADNRSRSRTGIPYLMDLPVIGRFFGSTSDTVDRTELVMLITPHVIRNRDESKQITEEFKNSLSTVRNELERIAREKEKLQSTPRPEPKPAAPGPSGDVVPKQPAPAPSAVPVAPGASIAPLKKIALQSDPTSSSGAVVGLARPSGPVPANKPASAPRQAPATPEIPQVKTPPAYALSVTRPAAANPVAPVKDSAKAELRPRPVEKMSAPLPSAVKPEPSEIGSARHWTVQVAAFAGKPDAEALAASLTQRGYHAYVMTADVDHKTWHRVRVGRVANWAEAAKLQSTLRDLEKIPAAFAVRQVN